MSRTYDTSFFSVMSSPDLWFEFKKHMFPGKKSTSFANYRSGDIAAYYGYLSLIKHNTRRNCVATLFLQPMPWILLQRKAI